MVRKPKVFLFDEPLSNLDAKMRVEMRDEIVQLHRRVGATMIYVTHDQVEAMTMADRIVVMNQGRVQQISPPGELYESPANRFVASFIGSPPMNFLRGILIAAENGMEFQETCPEGTGIRWILPDSFHGKWSRSGQAEVILGLRPEHLHPFRGQTPPGHGILEADLRRIEPIVPETILHLKTAGHTLLARVPELKTSFREGEKVRLLADLGRASLFCPETGDSLTS
jgi:multiple sugar transport system ATP-binding protein